MKKLSFILISYFPMLLFHPISTATTRFNVLESRFGCLIDQTVAEHQQMEHLIAQCTIDPKNCQTTYDCSHPRDNLEGVLFTQQRNLSQSRFGSPSVKKSIKNLSFADHILCEHCDFQNTVGDATTGFTRVPLGCSRFTNASLSHVAFTGDGNEITDAPPQKNYLHCAAPGQFTQFDNADLSFASFSDTIIDETVNFHCAKLQSTSFAFSHLKNVHFEKCPQKILQSVSFYKSHLENVAFQGALLQVNFEQAVLQSTAFANQFPATNFNKATLNHVTFGSPCTTPENCKITKAHGLSFQGSAQQKTIMNDVKFFGKEIHLVGLVISQVSGSSDAREDGAVSFGNLRNQQDTSVVTLNGNLAGSMDTKFRIYTPSSGTVSLSDLNCSQINPSSRFSIQVSHLLEIKNQHNFSISDSCNKFLQSL